MKERLIEQKFTEDDKHYMQSKWVAGRPTTTVFLQQNLWFGEMLEQVHSAHLLQKTYVLKK